MARRSAWLDDEGRAFVAAKMALHAGGKLPALTAGRRGTHFYEVVGAAAKTIADLGGSWYDPKTDVLVVALQTDRARTLTPFLLRRADVAGGGKLGVEWLQELRLRDVGADALSRARELPVPGRVEGFSVAELVARTKART
jgi:hypothetical protein